MLLDWFLGLGVRIFWYVSVVLGVLGVYFFGVCVENSFCGWVFLSVWKKRWDGVKKVLASLVGSMYKHDH